MKEMHQLKSKTRMMYTMNNGPNLLDGNDCLKTTKYCVVIEVCDFFSLYFNGNRSV